ncbi:MAG: Gfo/Idh/MocA family oxidoreductase [Planctomycetes bacterium]|nr:Gfo/Idh/MocA family oxidoreductase [Planctomycetota bacterium]
MGISLGLVGLGAFGSTFADLFRRHPVVDRVALCDREPQRIRVFADRPDWADKFSPRDAYDSLDAICRADLDALVIITQPWLHAPQCIQAMEAGKHVYSAVPVIMTPDADEILGWCDRLIRTAERTGMSYMLGETTFYRPQTMFCRRKAAEGAFGDFVYAEGEYFHDVDAGGYTLRQVQEHRETGAAGCEWVQRKAAYRRRGVLGGPMHYPTHSTSGPVAIMNAHAVSVTAQGYRNRTGDPFFDDSAFSNETALFRMSNGAVVRICEYRECAGPFHDSETFRIMGTRGAFAENTWRSNGRRGSGVLGPDELQTLTDDAMRDPLPDDVARAWYDPAAGSVAYGGHGGSHAYLVHEFVDAVAAARLPAINAWQAVRYMAMGAVAHQSALRDGETLAVPDWGDGPAQVRRPGP